MLTRENGKTLAEATLEVGAPAAMLRHSAAQALTEVGIAAELAPGRYFSSVAEPVGVVAIIVPWNSPVALTGGAVQPFPRSCARRREHRRGKVAGADRAHQCACRRDCVEGAVTARRRCQHVHRVGQHRGAVSHRIGRCGHGQLHRQHRVGRLIAAAGAKTLKRMNLELGGKTPMIVFDDASLASILPLSAASVTTLCRPELHGGLADRRPARHRHDEKDAIERANATEFGLAAGVFTRDVDRARRLSRQINAGTVWTNTWMVINSGFEEGGYKQSGIGRLGGARGLAVFQKIKTYVHLVPPAT
jgi:acyl-CoA reductase-like NAD-dependent aldehyde dehydrogenase